MLKKTIKYKDFNEKERTEDFYFNLTKAEAMELQLSESGGLTEVINQISNTQDAPTIIKIFKDIILKAYGEKSPDGKRFVKIAPDGHRLADDFAQTNAYSELFMELAQDSQKAAEFFKKIIPSADN